MHIQLFRGLVLLRISPYAGFIDAIKSIVHNSVSL